MDSGDSVPAIGTLMMLLLVANADKAMANIGMLAFPLCAILVSVVFIGATIVIFAE